MVTLPVERVRELLDQMQQRRVLVVGDVMLDQFVWGRVSRISPEAPVPVVDFERESFMPGGAANVARNLTSLGAQADLFGAVGHDPQADQLRALLKADKVGAAGLVPVQGRLTSTKTRIVAHQQQVTRLDRETRGDLSEKAVAELLEKLDERLEEADAVSVGDYGKGVVTQGLLDALKDRCRAQGKWLSLDPKPVHCLDLTRISLITPNRKEAFELAGLEDTTRCADPIQDTQLQKATEYLLRTVGPAILLITLGELGMLLCHRGSKPVHIPTVAQEVFDVSGAGDTVIASFTAAITAGASPLEAAIFSNHAAGVVVGKVGTATVTPEELIASFAPQK
jgi:D-glycero-beta-D-manno-heptose-7-phosphate kinase